MNFLAHLYLSGENDGLKIGNFIGDFVKGNKYLDYPVEIQKGILLHRLIDHFTDTNSIVKEAANLFKKDYGRYSGVIVDVFFDHFLGANWENYSNYNLLDYTQNVHNLLLANFRNLPLRVQKFLPFLILHKRLESYSNEVGVRKTLEIMSNYTSLPAKTNFAIKVFQENRESLAENFRVFMKSIIGYVESECSVEIKKPLSWSRE